MSAVGRILPFVAGGVHVRSWPTAARDVAIRYRLLYAGLRSLGLLTLRGGSRASCRASHNADCCQLARPSRADRLTS